MMNNPLISIIMPAYNAERYIAESIESVQAQTYPNWELIIIDDGSNDSTFNVVNQYSLKDSRIRYIYQENQKQGKARNTGIQNSKGELIAFLDSDDLWTPEKLKIQVKFFINHKYDLIFSDGYLILNDKNNVLGTFNTIQGEYGGNKAIKLFFTQNRIPILSVLTTKYALEKAGGFDENLQIQNVEDYHLWIKMLFSEFTFYGLPDKLVYYRQHDLQVTNHDSASSEKVFFMFSDYLKFPKKHNALISMAKLNWGKNWYCIHAKDSTIARLILSKLSLVPEFTYIAMLIKIVLIIFGVKPSKALMKTLIKPRVAFSLVANK